MLIVMNGQELYDQIITDLKSWETACISFAKMPELQEDETLNTYYSLLQSSCYAMIPGYYLHFLEWLNIHRIIVEYGEKENPNVHLGRIEDKREQIIQAIDNAKKQAEKDENLAKDMNIVSSYSDLMQTLNDLHTHCEDALKMATVE